MTSPDSLLAIVAAATSHDGVKPLNDSAQLVLQAQHPGEVIIAEPAGEPLGFAVADHQERTVQLVVAPTQRGQGVGTQLLAQLLERFPDYGYWSFGTLEAASQLAATAGLVAARQLLLLGKELPPPSSPRLPAGYQIGPFQPSEAAAIVALNAAAFRDHPEQGQLSLDDFHALSKQPWFDPSGLLVARSGSEVAGFHWTKQHDQELGEVYVLATSDRHRNLGLGRALLEAGLAHLAQLGCNRVQLYVESDHPSAISLYKSAKFIQISVDTQYRRQGSRK